MLLSHDESEDGVAVVRPNTGHGARRMPLFKLRANYTHCTPKQVNRLSDATVFSFRLHLFVFFYVTLCETESGPKVVGKGIRQVAHHVSGCHANNSTAYNKIYRQDSYREHESSAHVTTL